MEIEGGSVTKNEVQAPQGLQQGLHWSAQALKTRSVEVMKEPRSHCVAWGPSSSLLFYGHDGVNEKVVISVLCLIQLYSQATRMAD
jgi:hypothetical protein